MNTVHPTDRIGGDATAASVSQVLMSTAGHCNRVIRDLAARLGKPLAPADRMVRLHRAISELSAAEDGDRSRHLAGFRQQEQAAADVLIELLALANDQELRIADATLERLAHLDRQQR